MIHLSFLNTHSGTHEIASIAGGAQDFVRVQRHFGVAPLVAFAEQPRHPPAPADPLVLVRAHGRPPRPAHLAEVVLCRHL